MVGLTLTLTLTPTLAPTPTLTLTPTLTVTLILTLSLALTLTLRWLAAVISALVPACYVTMGGMRASLFSDAVRK